MSKSGKYNNAFEATVNGILDLFRTKERIAGLGPDERLDGKTVLISGASSGLGLATTIDVAKLGARVIMGCRSGIPDKGELVTKESGNSDVVMIHVDLSSFDSIDTFIEELTSLKRQIDVVICNAAIVPGRARKTEDGLEEMFVVNYLSKFYLVNQLIARGLLADGGSTIPRVIFVSSESHRNPTAFEWDSFGQYIDYSMKEVITRYGYFKLLMTTFARELARRHNKGSQQPIEVRALCPGPVNSSIAREAPSVFKPLLKVVFGIFFKSPADACEPVVYFAAKRDTFQSFDYLYLMSRRQIDAQAELSQNGQKLWNASQQLINEVHPRVN